jgi:hypothetical protein
LPAGYSFNQSSAKPEASMPKRKKLPIGIQTFREIREGGYYYVDKTGFALRLIDEGKYYFLSRPRRFGKSLFLDTLAELFAGSEALFTGLEAHARWDWSRRFPVVRLSFGAGVVQSAAALEVRIRELLRISAEELGLTLRQDADISGQFAGLIREAHANCAEPVVVLVDEYDKPILDNLTRPEAAREIRDGLRNLYSVIKDSDAHIRFAFLTGVSKFSKVSLFSGLNNLKDITVDARYSAICGYTEADLDEVFAPELPGLDRAQIRDSVACAAGEPQQSRDGGLQIVHAGRASGRLSTTHSAVKSSQILGFSALPLASSSPSSALPAKRLFCMNDRG